MLPGGGKYTTPVPEPVCCQAGESIQLQCQGLCAARRGKYTTQVPGPVRCQAGEVYNSSVRACVLPGGGKYTTPVPGPVCCQAGKVYNSSARPVHCQAGEVYNSSARAFVLPGPVCCQGLCAAVTGESVATQQDEDFRQSWGGTVEYCWVLLGTVAYC